MTYTCTKTKHASRQAALDVMRRMWRNTTKGSGKLPVRVYRCGKCSTDTVEAWHTTSRPRN